MNKPTNPNLLLYLVIGIGFIGGYFYNSQLGEADSEAPQPQVITDFVEKYKDFNIDFSVLVDPKINELQVFGEAPVLPGEIGKVDIFEPAK